MREILCTMLLLTAALGGCIGAGETPADPAGTASADETRTLGAPPDLQVGEWWTFEATWTFGGSSYEGTLVVTERTEEGVHLGVSGDTPLHDVVELHMPPVGIVPLETLAWNVHGSAFEPLRFPLEAGESWTSEWGPTGDEVQVEVIQAKGSTAQVKAVGQNAHLEYTYDAEQGMITSFQASEGTFEITGHGVEYEGQARTPTEVDMDFFGGRLAGVVDLAAFPAPGPPVESAKLDRDVSHASVGLFLGNYPIDGPSGLYRVAATAPDGTTFERTFAQDPTGPGSVMELAGHDAVQGTWEFEYAAGGAGVAAVEILGYDLHETTLPASTDPGEGAQR